MAYLFLVILWVALRCRPRRKFKKKEHRALYGEMPKKVFVPKFTSDAYESWKKKLKIKD